MAEVTRVLMITPDFGFGGAEKSFSFISRIIAEKYETHVVVFNLDIKQYYHTYGTLHVLGVRAGRNWAEKILFFFLRVWRLRKLKKKLNADVSLSFLEGADYVNVLSKVNDKVIINMRGSKLFDPNIRGVTGWIRKKILLPWLYNKVNAFTLVSEGLADELHEHFNIRKSIPYSVIPNFCNCSEIEQLSREALAPGAELLFKKYLTIVTVGRIAYEKGYDLLIPVFKLLQERIPEIKWLIIGSGPFEQSLKAMMRENNLRYEEALPAAESQASVWFIGFQKNPFQYVARSTVFVLSSRTEGFPNALLEAMACGAPVVAANCPYGPAEMLIEESANELPKQSYGLLLAPLSSHPDTIHQWADGIERILRDSVLRTRMSRSAQIRAQYYSAERVAERWYKLIEEVK